MRLPVIARDSYGRCFGAKTAKEIVRDHVLRLTYTSDDMSPLARDLGYTGLPFVWDAEERRHLRARLDALYFHLYGLSKDDAGYILDTFPIVRRARRGGVRQLPHQRAHPRLHEHPRRRRHRDRSERVTKGARGPATARIPLTARIRLRETLLRWLSTGRVGATSVRDCESGGRGVCAMAGAVVLFRAARPRVDGCSMGRTG